ncbi:MAG: glycosyltransferase [archaeon]
MEGNILFIADSPLSSPILHSQGIPLFQSIAKDGNKAVFLTLENINSITKYNELRLQLLDKENADLHFEYALIKRIKPLPSIVSYFFYSIRKTIKIVREHHIDIIHGRSLFPSIVAFLMKILFKNDIKILYDMRGTLIEEEIQKGKWKANSLRVKLLRRIENILIRKSDQIVVVSNVFKKYIVYKHGPRKRKLSEKITVISNKTSLKNIIPLENLSKKKESDRIICVYSGSAAYWQNLEGMFQFFKESIELFPNIYFKIFSYENSSFKEYLDPNEELSNRLIIEKLDPSVVQKSLAECNFGVLLRENNLINNVASPLKFGEYLAAGLPVMVSKGIGDTEEIIRKYNVGVVIEDDNYHGALKSMYDLLKEPDIYNRCFEVAACEFNIEDSIKAYKDIYSKMLTY